MRADAASDIVGWRQASEHLARDVSRVLIDEFLEFAAVQIWKNGLSPAAFLKAAAANFADEPASGLLCALEQLAASLSSPVFDDGPDVAWETEFGGYVEKLRSAINENDMGGQVICADLQAVFHAHASSGAPQGGLAVGADDAGSKWAVVALSPFHYAQGERISTLADGRVVVSAGAQRFVGWPVSR